MVGQAQRALSHAQQRIMYGETLNRKVRKLEKMPVTNGVG